MQIKRFFKYFGIGIAVIIIGVVVAGQIAYYSIEEIDPPGEMYLINDLEIHMLCTGSENDNMPTIIIVPGGGASSYAYYSLQENLSEKIRTCSYDPAGLGWSESNDIPYTAKNLSSELEQLLEVAQIDGPIILAGHSLGGIVSLIYSAEHEDQVVGIAFIDSSHYNEVDYYGKEFREATEKEIKKQLANFWMIEFASRLGIISIMNIFDSSGTEIERDHKKRMVYFDRWNPPYPVIKSMTENIFLSFEQGKEPHYHRGDLPIVSISASGVASKDSFELGGVSSDEVKKGFKELHKDLANLSTKGKHGVINGTNHVSIVYHDKTAEHILSLIPLIGEK